MLPQTLEQACTPRSSVFDPTVRDTVYNIDDLPGIDPERFFAENYVTQGMRQLLTEAMGRLAGTAPNSAGAFLLSQSMGGGKTHNLIALGLLARHPQLRQKVMAELGVPAPTGSVRVVTFSGRKTHTPFGVWGEIAQQLNRKETFADFYGPLKPPGDNEWVELLRGDPTLILLDELPPYFEAAQAVPVGSTTLDVITTTALANLLVAVTSGKLPNACLVITDLRSSAYGAGSERVNAALGNLAQEANRSVVRIDPVRLASDELYQIMRTRLFDALPDGATIDAVADAYAQAVDEARKTDLTAASPQQMRAEVRNAYPFHPGIRDLFARFRENPGFQQTRALIRIMRIVVADLWQSGAAGKQHLIAAHDLDLHRADTMSEIRQINPSLENAVAHDIANEGRTAVAEQIDGPGKTDAQDAATLIFLSSLSQAVNPTLGLDRSQLAAYLVAPGRDANGLRAALDRFQAEAWYLHATSAGALLFKNVENLNAKLESYASAMLGEQRETELRERLKEMFAPKTGACYQDLQPLPALDQVQPVQDRVTLVVFRPVPGALEEVTAFWGNQPYKNRLLFLSGNPANYQRVLERSAYLRAIRQIVTEFKQGGMRDADPQMAGALHLQTREEAQFYVACRETFQVLHYPHRNGLIRRELDPKYVANKYEGEQQVVAALAEVHKYRPDADADSSGFRSSLENKLWPEGLKEVAWADVKRRAATDPSWVWHHPRALDDLRDELVRRDTWRDLGGGFVQRGPFPPPKPSVTVQQLNRDPHTGEVTLRVTPRHADTVYKSGNGSATSIAEAEKLESYDVKTSDLTLSFLAVNGPNGGEPGEPITWTNTIDVKYDWRHQNGQLYCELRAIPAGAIRYTTDGSSPANSGQAYTEPFPVPTGARMVLAQATAAGITSNLLKVDVPDRDDPSKVIVDPQKPATWKHRLTQDATGETYAFLDQLAKKEAAIGGARLDITASSHWITLQTDEGTFQAAPTVREQAALLAGIVTGGNLTLEVEALRFRRGQDLLDTAADLKTEIQAGEVEQ